MSKRTPDAASGGEMPMTVEDLPSAIRAAMPEGAQELYLAAYNRALESGVPGPDTEFRPLDEVAHDAGMLAVSREYRRREDGAWCRDPVGEHMATPKAHGTG